MTSSIYKPVAKNLQPATSGDHQFPALTGIRAIAAFMVFFHHLPLQLVPGELTGLQITFYTGVTLFFVLSGLLITWRYYGRIEFSYMYGWNYFVNRFARIFPVYFLILTIVIVLQKNYDPVYLIQNYTLTHNLHFLFPSRGLAILPSWSLTVEECFYLLAPAIFFLTGKWKLPVPLLVTLALFILIIMTYADGKFFSQKGWWVISSSFFGHTISFFSGITAGLLLLQPIKRTEGRSAVFTITGLMAILVITLPLVYVTNKDEALKIRVISVFNNVLLPVAVAIFYIGLAREKSLVQSFLSRPLLKLFGKSSYAFYLIHYPIIHLFGKEHIQPLFSDRYYNIYVILVFLCTLVLSIITFLLFEQPVNRLLRNRLLIKTTP